MHCPHSQIEKIAVKEVAAEKKIGGSCYSLPFYSDQFPYILASDTNDRMQLVNTLTSDRINLIKLRRMHVNDKIYDFSFSVRFLGGQTNNLSRSFCNMTQ